MKGKDCCHYFVILMLLLPACRESSESVAGKDNGQIAAEVTYPQTPEEVVAVFCENFFESAPPNSDNEAAKTAYMLLSSATQSSLSGVRAGLSSRLAMFAGVQELPGHGFHIRGVLAKTEEEALVETCWHYTSGEEDSITAIKVFALAWQEGMWKIDEIQRK
jgi:hypothetical protein